MDIDAVTYIVVMDIDAVTYTMDMDIDAVFCCHMDVDAAKYN